MDITLFIWHTYYFVVFYFITFYFKVKSIEILPKNNNLRLAFSFDEWMAIFYLGIWITWFFKSKVYLHINLELVVPIVCLLSSRGKIGPRANFSRFFENLTIALKKSFSSPILGHRPYQRPFNDPRFSLLFKRKSALESRLFKRVYTYIEMTSVITKSCVMAVFTWIVSRYIS